MTNIDHYVDFQRGLDPGFRSLKSKSLIRNKSISLDQTVDHPFKTFNVFRYERDKLPPGQFLVHLDVSDN